MGQVVNILADRVIKSEGKLNVDEALMNKSRDL